MDQIELSFENSNETQDILDLIKKAKRQDEQAIIDLFNRYKQLFNGKYIRKYINFNLHDLEEDDIVSIIKIIFFDAIKYYDPTRSKFITYLMKRIMWKFKENYLKERFVPLSNNNKAVEINKQLEKTEHVLVLDLQNINTFSSKEQKVRFKFGKESFEMPIEIFINTYIIDKIESYIPKKCFAIYKRYMKEFIEDPHGAITRTANLYNRQHSSVIKCINKCHKIFKSKMKIKNIEVV